VTRTRTLALALALAAAAGLAGAAGCDGETEWKCTVPDGVDPAWMRTIGCQADYELLWDDRDDAVFARTTTVNWIIDREDGDRVYFIDTVRFLLHHTFAAGYLDVEGKTPVGDRAEFQLLNYRRPNRRFVMGKLMHYLDQDLLTLELSAGDTADADMIAFAFGRIRDSVFDGDRLLYRAVSADQEAMLPALVDRIPVIHTEDVFAGQTYQPLHQKVGYGTLVFRRLSELTGTALLPTEIVVLDHVPNDISMVSGIITQEFQTPLAHVNILSKNRGTPNMALRGAFDDPALRALDGQLVRIEVTPQQYVIGPGDPVAAQAYWDGLRPAAPLLPVFDLSVVGPQPLAARGFDDAISIGSKAANMAEMMQIVDEDGFAVRLPDQPFGVPFAHFDAHLTEHGLWDAIDAVITDAPALDPTALQQRLFAIRMAIYQAPLDAAFRAELVDAVRSRWGDDTKVRFRSSTNAEDLADFSGAGLYTSASGKLRDGDATIENALKVVWASAWNYQAFVERDFYRVDHRAIRMGVLVHPAFVGETANGVAITINEFQKLRPAFYINAQVGDISVTNPTGFATPEQILYYTWYEEPEYEVITRSSLAAGPVMSEDELAELARYLEAIHGHFDTFVSGAEFAMDVEFKLDADRDVIIKQARPLKRR
jgi:hypothetical protein